MRYTGDHTATQKEKKGFNVVEGQPRESSNLKRRSSFVIKKRLLVKRKETHAYET